MDAPKECFHDLRLSLVFELHDTDLAKYLKDLSTQLSNLEIQRIMFQLLCGLRYMNSMHVFHRDLKPANILLSVSVNSQNRKYITDVKIADFGFARLINVDERPSQSHSQQGVVRSNIPKFPNLPYSKGPVTLWYRAPEIILVEPYSTSVDVWSLGCIFAEMLGKQNRKAFGTSTILLEGKE